MDQTFSGISPQQLIAQSVPEECENCGGEFFTQAFMFRRVSKILVGGTQDQLLPIPVFKCMDCGSPIMDMVPKDEEPVNNNREGKIIQLGDK
jgi:hypothetical protein